ncbi:unnamed protein product [Gongylonema pulchrum]|uniref:Rod shape-determining protein MreD n=1 Tax=Gongylonema pulchrum TaxID=637853 RepID=A0A183DDG2_9BILA|nr:unnamed protein product [Gongylonema pulchrum]
MLQMIYLFAGSLIVAGYNILGVDQFVVSPILTLTALTYLCQTLFRIPSLAYIVIGVGSFFIGANCTSVVILLENQIMKDEALLAAYHFCSIAFLVIPHYNFGMALFRLNFVAVLRIQGGIYLGT